MASIAQPGVNPKGFGRGFPPLFVGKPPHAAPGSAVDSVKTHLFAEWLVICGAGVKGVIYGRTGYTVSSRMKISLIQTDIAWNDPAQSIARCETLTSQALTAGGEFLVFPEMFTCGFSMPSGDMARQSAAQGLNFLTSVARTNEVHTLGSLPETSESGELYNTAWLCSPEGVKASYRKIHLFSYGDETTLYSPGNSYATTLIGDLRCSLFICYDLRFGHPFMELAPKTDVFLIVANWPATRREHWLTLLRARAIENQAYVVGVNRVGVGGGLEYSGDSAAFGPDGSELGRLDGSPGVLTVDATPNVVASWRDTFPALRDRKISVYKPLT